MKQKAANSLKGFTFLLILPLLFHCASYVRARERDFYDIWTATTNFSFGASVRIGPIPIGLEVRDPPAKGLRGGFFGKFEVGEDAYPYGNCLFSSTWPFALLEDELRSPDPEIQCLLDARGKSFSRDEFPVQRFGNAGISMGLLFGFRFEVNFLELLDFALGIVYIDLLDDDGWAEPPSLFNYPSTIERCKAIQSPNRTINRK